MKRLKSYINKLVNIMVNVKGFPQSLSGHISTVGKEYILFLDQDKNERPIKKSSITKVIIIKNENQPT